MKTVTIDEAQAKLPELIASAESGEDVVITRMTLPVARLVGEPNASAKARRPGSARGKLLILVDDDEHLRDFAEYMP